MEEKKIFTGAVILSVFLFFLNFVDIRLLFAPLTADYTAVLTVSSTITLNETFNFKVKKDNKYSMLFRNWKVPIVFSGEKLNFPFILVNSVKSKKLWYVVDYKHRVYLKVPDKVAAAYCAKKAFDNEIGIMNEKLKKFPEGTYSLSAFYSVYPPVSTDGEFSHVNLKLADSHVYYPKVKIFLKDSGALIEKLYVHMVNYSIKKVDGGYLISGTAPSNSLVEIEMILKGKKISGFYRNVPDIISLTERANRNVFVSVSKMVNKFILFISFILPFGMVVYYWYFGKENFSTVPEFISYIPDKKKKPYIVNLLFSGNATSCDENGFYATLLDLKRRRLIDLKETDEGILIEVLSDKVDDPYERAVLSFVLSFSDNVDGRKVLNLKSLNEKVKKFTEEKNLSLLKSMKERFDSILHWSDGSVIYRYLDLTGYELFKSVAIPFMIFLVFFAVLNLVVANPLIDVYKVLISCGVLFFQLLIFILLPPQILGSWKGKRYREKLLWDGFRNFLSNLAMIKKYAPSDISIWKEWLVYATALGVADKVERAMRELNISMPEVREERVLRAGFGGVYYEIGRGISSLTSGSSGSGGGFGAGGGFGGGGAGGR